MTVILKSTEVQQNFGAMLDRAMSDDDVIVERYGSPRVAIVNYRRYQALLEAERELIRLRLQQASAAAAQRAEMLTDDEVTALIEEARTEVYKASKR
jgi:PHD/YefM family antitoxin component YafN of YafNO toxin-antitoxin module